MSQPQKSWESYAQYTEPSDDLYGSNVEPYAIPVPTDKDFWRVSPEYPPYADETKPPFFSVAGRLNRKGYFLQMMAVGFGLVCAIIVLVTLLMVAVDTNTIEQNPMLAFGLGMLIAALLIPLQLRLNIKRLHDLGFSGYWAILMLAPIVNVLLAWALLLWPGQAYPNRYGNPPK